MAKNLLNKTNKAFLTALVGGASLLSSCDSLMQSTGMKKGTQYEDTVKVENLKNKNQDSTTFYLNTVSQEADNNFYSAMREVNGNEWHYRTDPLLAYEARKDLVDSIPKYELQSLKIGNKGDGYRTGIKIGKREEWAKEEKMVNNAIEKFYEKID